MSARAEGWGLATGVPRDRRTTVASLLCPLWVPILLVLSVLLFDAGVLALAVLVATVIFVPGVLIIANYVGWPRWVRFVASLAYVVMAEAAYIATFYAAAKLTSLS